MNLYGNLKILFQQVLKHILRLLLCDFRKQTSLKLQRDKIFYLQLHDPVLLHLCHIDEMFLLKWGIHDVHKKKKYCNNNLYGHINTAL